MRLPYQFLLASLAAMTVGPSRAASRKSVTDSKRACTPHPASESTNGNSLTCTGQAAGLAFEPDTLGYMTACEVVPGSSDAPKFMAMIPEGQQHCGEKITVTNPHGGKKVDVTVVEQCFDACGGSDTATMRVNDAAYKELFGVDSSVGGVYDVKYDEL